MKLKSSKRTEVSEDGTWQLALRQIDSHQLQGELLRPSWKRKKDKRRVVRIIGLIIISASRPFQTNSYKSMFLFSFDDHLKGKNR